jgi:hypothetical protein
MKTKAVWHKQGQSVRYTYIDGRKWSIEKGIFGYDVKRADDGITGDTTVEACELVSQASAMRRAEELAQQEGASKNG